MNEPESVTLRKARRERELATACAGLALVISLGVVIYNFGAEPVENINARHEVEVHRKILAEHERLLRENEKVLVQNNSAIAEMHNPGR